MGGGRAACCSKLGLNRGAWTPEEDLKLIAHINNHGHHNWRALPKLAGLLRCGKSCRLRWINYLRPDLKRGNFTPEEEETIFRLHRMLGNKWSKIAARLPGRTDNEIKNVWNTHLKKRLRSSSSVEEEGKAEEPQSSSSASSALNQPGQQEATAEDGSSWWVVEYLEKELGLSDEIQNNQVSGAAEAAGLMQEDPVSTYFLRELSSSSDLGAPLCFEDAGSVQIH